MARKRTVYKKEWNATFYSWLSGIKGLYIIKNIMLLFIAGRVTCIRTVPRKKRYITYMILPFTGGGMAWKRTVHCQRVRGLIYAQEI